MRQKRRINMSLKVNTEQICSREIICRTVKEQSIELDYILPDYYPEIFRIIRCTAVPSAVSCAVNGNRLTYELSVLLRIIYCSGSGSSVYTVERRLNYSGSVDIEDNGILPASRIIPAVDYINCRAVTGRRIDVRGAVSVSVTVTAQKTRSVISDVFGDNILLKKQEIVCPSPEIYSEKRITVSEDIDLGSEKPPVSDILRCSAAAVPGENKAIANKLAVKGDIKVSMLYSSGSEDDTPSAPESMQFVLPYSQIMDMDGLDERCEVTSYVTAVSCELRPKSDGSGESHTVECEVMLLIICTASRYSPAMVAVDEFSPIYATEHKTEDIKIPLAPVPVNYSGSVRQTAELHDGNIESVYDSWCEVTACDMLREEDGGLTAVGKALLCSMVKCYSGEIAVISADVPFRFENVSGSNVLSADAVTDAEAVPLSCSYSITSDNSAEIKAELQLTGIIRNYMHITGITEISADEDDPLPASSDAAVKLYFAEKGEDLWDTAKRCRTSPQAIMEENALDSEIMSEDAMIIIPIIR